MLEESVAAIINTDIKIFGVTALTSLSDSDTNYIYKRQVEEQVMAMIELATKSNIHGVVCSPQELSLVKNNSNLLTITPGIRLNSKMNDQKRILTPRQAYKNGSNWLVIGRPITKGNIKKNISSLIDHLNQ